MKKEKILYFEGAGCVPCNDVENCRIRTAFTNKEGQKIYIEFISGYVTNKIEYGKNGRKLKNPKYISEDGHLICDFCFYITNDPNIDDCNYSTLKCERNQKLEKEFKYTKENILNFVNTYCNADFDKIVVLDNLAGFRVHSNGKRHTYKAYNYGDEFKYNEELTKRRIKKVKELSEHYKKLFDLEYDNTSYYIENNELIVRINVSDKQLKETNISQRKFVVEV